MESGKDVEISTGSVLPDEYLNEDEIIGYVEPWIASPGETVSVKVSSTIPQYKWSLVRSVQGLELPRAPPLKRETIYTPEGESAIVNGTYKRANPGSHALVSAWKKLNASKDQIDGLRCKFFVQPWLPESDHTQVLVSTLDASTETVGFSIFLDKSGKVGVHVGVGGGTVHTVSTGVALRRWRWAAIEVELRKTGVVVRIDPAIRLSEKAPAASSLEEKFEIPALVGGSNPLSMASGFFDDDAQAAEKASGMFNGKLDSPTFEVSYKGGPYKTWAKFDFSLDMSTDSITDVSGSARHGILVNAPTRAVKGHDWDGSEPDWTKAKFGYNAIHFHEDDLDDAAWETDFTVAIPKDVPSGAYAVVVKGVDHEDVEDVITFFVRPPERNDASGPKVAMVFSTFTYLAYANEHMYDEDRASHMELAGGVKIRKDHHWRRMARRTDLGLGMYDVHRDGSGTVFSSAKRPILNIRPSYVNWAFHRPREFSADQLMVGFMEEKLGRGNYDVLTDHDLHAHGVEAISSYDVVITGCHPEYPSLASLNAYAAYARAGGSLMYLGGNGFYWCSETDPARPHRMEVRRGEQGCRSFGLPSGEWIHSLNGSQGGLWRSRGRNPQTLFGIGSCACGSGPGVPYRALEAGKSPEFSWVWEGVTESGEIPLIGTEGFGGGASGDEIDRLDYDLGSPENTVLLATSTGHDDSFGLFNEEAMFPMVDTLGTTCAKVRSDMTYYETSGGGYVFSVGSINWFCSLGWDAYKNNVAGVTWNVLREFLRRGADRRGM